MSRIGKLPIPVLDKANVVVDGQTVRVDGPKGQLEKTFDGSINIELADGEIRQLERADLSLLKEGHMMKGRRLL